MLPNDEDLQESVPQGYDLADYARLNQSLAPAGQGGFETLTIEPDPHAALEPPARGIFAKWLRVLTHPSVATFASEIPAASWGTTLLGVIIFTAFFLLFNIFMGILTHGEALLDSPSFFFIKTSAIYGFIVEVIVLFIGSVLIFGLSKVSSRSTHNFAAQTYLYSLYIVPLAIFSMLFSPFPISGVIIYFVTFLYGILLTYDMVQAIHRLDAGSARVVVLVILLAPVFFFICSGMLIVSIFRVF